MFSLPWVALLYCCASQSPVLVSQEGVGHQVYDDQGVYTA